MYEYQSEAVPDLQSLHDWCFECTVVVCMTHLSCVDININMDS
jgi:hypothetical protein